MMPLVHAHVQHATMVSTAMHTIIIAGIILRGESFAIRPFCLISRGNHSRFRKKQNLASSHACACVHAHRAMN